MVSLQPAKGIMAISLNVRKYIRTPCWQVNFGAFLLLLSALFYGVYFLVTDTATPASIAENILGKLAFMPIQVLLLTLVINSLLSHREKKARLEKLNMVIGAFFSEIGTPLLAFLAQHDPQMGELRPHLLAESGWTEEKFQSVHDILCNFNGRRACDTPKSLLFKIP